jgi:hypothetical protein
VVTLIRGLLVASMPNYNRLNPIPKTKETRVTIRMAIISTASHTKISPSMTIVQICSMLDNV